uniref:Peroxisomal sarcosine oxidase n=1 Tax=Esox lucius TaxID=8010 RepID=A0A3P9A7W5_ESOLU
MAAQFRNYDCIVIGAGVHGSFTAYNLAKKNKKTILLEQFVLPHSRGSSHGQTRVIRKAYDRDYYTQMMEECYQLWSQLEKEANVKLYRRTGLLVMGPERGLAYPAIKSTLERNKLPIVTLQREEFSQHIPNVNLSQGHGALVDMTAGVLYADRTLRTVQVRVYWYSRHPKGCHFDLMCTRCRLYRAKSLVIRAGPWANTLLSHTGLQLPLQVLKINVCYWKEKVPGFYNVQNRFPCFIQLESEEAKHDIYGLPSNEYPGLMKICYHSGPETDPDERDRQTDRGDIDILQRYITSCFPGLVPIPAIVESCMYTVTPDSHFVLDHHPTHPNIVIGAGFSGHGFKFGPIVGKLLCELSQGEVPSYDLSPFRIRRFQALSKSAL